MSEEYIQALDDLSGVIAFLPKESFARALKYFYIIEQALERLESIDNSNSIEALECLEKPIIRFARTSEDIDFKDYEEYDTIKNYILKAQEMEKENELLKEIIKSLFDRGCPLHQYTDNKGVLTIEVDNECSIMRLGEFKGVDLDSKLKEVLGNE